MSNPDAVEVILSDPGTGKVMRYPYDQFADAWSDSEFTMLATNDSPMDIENGILDTIMGIDTDKWLQTCGDLLQDGIEVAQSMIQYFQDNPQIVTAAVEILPMFLANNEEAVANCDIFVDTAFIDIN